MFHCYLHESIEYCASGMVPSVLDIHPPVYQIDCEILVQGGHGSLYRSCNRLFGCNILSPPFLNILEGGDLDRHIPINQVGGSHRLRGLQHPHYHVTSSSCRCHFQD